jgi:hypothetical protein
VVTDAMADPGIRPERGSRATQDADTRRDVRADEDADAEPDTGGDGDSTAHRVATANHYASTDDHTYVQACAY